MQIMILPNEKRSNRDRNETITNFRTMKETPRKDFLITEIGTKVSPSTHYSKVSDVGKLKPIDFREMFVGQIHFGQFLETTVMEEPFVIQNKVNFLVSDGHGQLEYVCIENYEFFGTKGNVSDMFPRGSKVIIKEPNLELDLKSSMKFFIKIHSPSDIEVNYDMR